MKRLGKFTNKMNKLNLTVNSRVLLLTHNDLDGSGPAVLLKSIFKNITVQHCSNGTMDWDIKNSILNKDVCNQYDVIFVTDISCTEESAYLINKDPDIIKLILLDHHSTALVLNKFDWALVEPMMLSNTFRDPAYIKMGAEGHSSGTSLMYDFLYNFGFNKFIRNEKLARTLVFAITAYDTWDWVKIFGKDKKYHDLNTLFWIYQAEMFDRIFTERISSSDEHRIFEDQDKLILEIEANRIQSVVRNKEKGFSTGTMIFDGKEYSIVYCFAEQYMSDIFERMKELYPDRDIAFINYGTGISLRSININVNVAEICKRNGGGGHPEAGGFKIPYDLQTKYCMHSLNAKIVLDEEIN